MAGRENQVDTIIINANVITIDPAKPRSQALAMNEGKFVAVGSTEDISLLSSPNTKVLDLAGKTVLPGFIDAHIHVLNSGIHHVMAADCDLRSIGAIQQALREQAGKPPAGDWVQGFKFDDTKTTERRFLSIEDLDAVSTTYPILVATGPAIFFT